MLHEITMKCTIKRLELEDAIKLAHRLRPIVVNYGTRQFILSCNTTSDVSVFQEAEGIYCLAQDEATGTCKLEVFDVNTGERTAEILKGGKELCESDPLDAVDELIQEL